jgi:hypothetical protein
LHKAFIAISLVNVCGDTYFLSKSNKA